MHHSPVAHLFIGKMHHLLCPGVLTVLHVKLHGHPEKTQITALILWKGGAKSFLKEV